MHVEPGALAFPPPARANAGENRAAKTARARMRARARERPMGEKGRLGDSAISRARTRGGVREIRMSVRYIRGEGG